MTLGEYLAKRHDEGVKVGVRIYSRRLPIIKWKRKGLFGNKQVPYQDGTYSVEWHAVEEDDVVTLLACQYYEPGLIKSNRLYRNGVPVSQNLPYDDTIAKVYDDIEAEWRKLKQAQEEKEAKEARAKDEKRRKEAAEEEKRKAAKAKAKREAIDREKYNIYRYLASTLSECEVYPLADIIAKKKQRDVEIAIESDESDLPDWVSIKANGELIMRIEVQYLDCDRDYGSSPYGYIKKITKIVVKHNDKLMPVIVSCRETGVSIFKDILDLYEAQEEEKKATRARIAAEHAQDMYADLFGKRKSQ